MQKLAKITDKTAISAAGAIFFLFTFYLMLASYLSTSVIDKKEHVFFRADSTVKLIFVTMFVFAVLVAVYRITKQNENQIKNIRKLVYIAVTAFAFIFILSVQLPPRADQAKVLEIASQLREGNISGYNKGAYLDIYPHQTKIIYFLYLLSFIFGKYNFIAMQLLNVVGFVISAFFLGKVTRKMFKSDTVAAITEIALLLYVPLLVYNTFVYGNIWGLALSLIAVDFEISYLENKKISYMIISAVFATISAMLKMNYIIVLVALIIFLLLDLIKNKSRIKTLSMIASTLAIYFILNSVVGLSMEKIAGTKSGDGVPFTAWIAMGLQDGWKCEGWYNGYHVEVYKENKYDTEKTKEAVAENISESVNQFKSGERDFISFFGRKTLSQWNDPTFQCVNLMQGHESSTQELSLFSDLMYGRNCMWIFSLFNLLHSVLLLGVFLWFITDFRRINTTHLILAVVFIGGFIFHLLWEAKAQYTVTYFVLCSLMQ